jgi:serine/threonine protein kinase/HEAT repeat protein
MGESPGSVPGYELLEEVGRGGMGVIYRARQLQPRRVVALKMILAGEHAGPDTVARFKAEAEAVARLSHPNIVQIYQVGEQSGRPFLALEFVEGGSLAKRLLTGPLPFEEAAALLEQLARAVDYAHRRGILHRDLKPANVLLAAAPEEVEKRRKPVPKITDFGLAKPLEASSSLKPGVRTQSGAIVGTPGYMAPEQAGAKGKKVGPAADVYALGAILYECLTGRPPFAAETVLDTLMKVVTEEPMPLARLRPRCPRDLETICLKCLHKDPQKRYATAGELAEDLRRYREGDAIQGKPPGRWERARRAFRRHKELAYLASGMVATALVLGAFLLTGERRTLPPPQTTPEPVPKPAEQATRLYNHVLKSTVWLVLSKGPNDIALGTGVLIDRENRLVLTNYHLVMDSQKVGVLFPIFQDGRLVQNPDVYLIALGSPEAVIKAQRVEGDETSDLALVQPASVPDSALPLGVATKDVEPDQNVHALGNPESVGQLWVHAPAKVLGLKNKWRFSRGEPGGPALSLESDVIMTGSPSNAADSGCPLVDDQGGLVGVNLGDPSSRNVGLFINRTQILRFIEGYCSVAGLTWEHSDRKLEGATRGPGGDDLPALVKDLSSNDALVRARAAQLLANLGPRAKSAVSDLIRLLEDPEPLPRRLAMEALGMIGRDSLPACAALLKVLKDPADASFREEAARTLGKIGPGVKDRAFPALIAALEDADKRVRMTAAEAIVSLGVLDAGDLPIAVVLKLIKDSSPNIRVRAARVLPFLAQGKEAIPALVAAYQAGDDTQMKLEVLASLTQFAEEAQSAVRVLTDALKSTNPVLVRAAIQATAVIDPKGEKVLKNLVVPASLVPTLSKVLAEDDYQARLIVVTLLEALGKNARAAAPALIPLFADERDLETRSLETRISSVLTKVGKEAVPDLTNALSNPNPDVRRGAAKTLGALGRVAESAAKKLSGLAQTDTSFQVREAAAQAYQSVTGISERAVQAGNTWSLAAQSQVHPCLGPGPAPYLLEVAQAVIAAKSVSKP